MHTYDRCESRSGGKEVNFFSFPARTWAPTLLLSLSRSRRSSLSPSLTGGWFVKGSENTLFFLKKKN